MLLSTTAARALVFVRPTAIRGLSCTAVASTTAAKNATTTTTSLTTNQVCIMRNVFAAIMEESSSSSASSSCMCVKTCSSSGNNCWITLRWIARSSNVVSQKQGQQLRNVDYSKVFAWKRWIHSFAPLNQHLLYSPCFVVLPLSLL